MSDDNQKFLEKFKSQITTMGKNGILGSDTNSIPITNINNNKIRKGSAFLKPIKKPKPKTADINKNNSIKSDINNNNDNTKNNLINNNPYINAQNLQKNNISPISVVLLSTTKSEYD